MGLLHVKVQQSQFILFKNIKNQEKHKGNSLKIASEQSPDETELKKDILFKKIRKCSKQKEKLRNIFWKSLMHTSECQKQCKAESIPS